MAKVIQIRNVPDEIHGELKSRAALAGVTLSNYLLQMMVESVSIPTKAEMWARLQSREPVNLGEGAIVEILREGRGTA